MARPCAYVYQPCMTHNPQDVALYMCIVNEERPVLNKLWLKEKVTLDKKKNDQT